MARSLDTTGGRRPAGGAGPQGRAHYAVLALTEIALRDCSAPVPLSEIAARHDLSLRYLEQIFVRLRRAGLVRSVRGPGGGYCLMPDARTVSIAAIMAAVEPDCDTTGGRAPAGGSGDGSGSDECPVCRLWDAFHSHALRYLEQVSLADVVAGRIPEGILASRERTGPAGPAGPAAPGSAVTAPAADGAI
ncbi:RrF2 family transcriptional regulator [Marinibaculum pumilum]|uniref:RrF2 family transcriptional regulator n=1 Tax=Marinibaculum pumilum TaxID=1766165 RepID=A0ABV7KWN0_9PROT